MNNEAKKLVLYGAGGLARETVALIRTINAQKKQFDFLGFVVDEEYFREGVVLNGNPVIGSRSWLIEHKNEVGCCIAIGEPKARRRIQTELTEQGVEFVSLIHPSVYIGDESVIGKGCLIQDRSAISCNCSLGDGVFFNSDVAVGHDTVVEDFVVCNPRVQISGNCKIEEAASIGAVSFLIQKITVGKEAVVAPGSIVFTKVKAGTYVMGNPAKRIEL